MGHWGKNACCDLVKSSLAAEVWFAGAGLFSGMMEAGEALPRFGSSRGGVGRGDGNSQLVYVPSVDVKFP